MKCDFPLSMLILRSPRFCAFAVAIACILSFASLISNQWWVQNPATTSSTQVEYEFGLWFSCQKSATQRSNKKCPACLSYYASEDSQACDQDTSCCFETKPWQFKYDCKDDAPYYDCESKKTAQARINAIQSMMILSFLSFLVATCLLARSIGRDKNGDAQHPKVSTLVLCILGSLFGIIAMSVFVASCPCDPKALTKALTDNTGKVAQCAAKGERYCLYYSGSTCDGTDQRIYGGGFGLTACCSSWVVGLIGGIGTFFASSNHESEASSLLRNARQKLDSIQGKSAIRRTAYFGVLLAVLEALVISDILGHGAQPYAQTVYPGAGVFFPFPGPFNPFMPMISIFFSFMGTIGVNRQWPNFVITYNLFAVISSMLFFWYGGQILHDSQDNAGIYPACLRNTCISVDDDEAKPQCAPRGVLIGFLYLGGGLNSLAACFFFGKSKLEEFVGKAMISNPIHFSQSSRGLAQGTSRDGGADAWPDKNN